jgi:serine protease Do
MDPSVIKLPPRFWAGQALAEPVAEPGRQEAEAAPRSGRTANDDPQLNDASPKTEDPKTEDPKTEDPKTEDPKTEDPKAEGPPAEASPKPSDPPGPADDNPQDADPSAPEAQQPPGEAQSPARPADESSSAEADGDDTDPPSTGERRRRTARFLQFTRFNDAIRAVVQEQVKSVANSTVEVYVDDQTTPSSLGMIVDAKGFVMTKASMLKGAVRCKLPNGRMVPAIVYGVDTDTDLALLRLQATNLSPITWSLQPEQEAMEGHWVLTPGIDGRLKSLGVVSVSPRKIPSISGFIGIQMAPTDGGVEVTQVLKGTAAERFGLKISDVIIAVNEEAVSEPSEMSALLRGKRPGDVVSLSVKRGSTTLALRVILGNREEDNPDNQRAINQNTMSGEISKRRDDFPIALQHDSVLTPEECGGPLVDLDGRVVGLNISRAGRVNSYALPTSLVQAVYERLATGEYSPEVVFAERLKGYENVLLSLNVEEVKLVTEQSEMEREAELQAKKAEATQESIAALQKQIDELKQKIDSHESELEAVETQKAQIKSKITSKQREIEKTREQKQDLEKEKKELLFGAN